MHAFSTVLSIALAASSAVAIAINTPSDWTTTGPNTITYSSVDTDPSTFAAILVNQDSSLLSSSIVLEANFSTSNTYFSVTPSSDYNAGSGYQVNFIRNTDSPNTIFNITSGSTSAASTSTGTSTSVKTTTSTGVSTTSTGTSTGTSTSTVDKHNGGDSTSSTASGSSVSATASNSNKSSGASRVGGSVAALRALALGFFALA
ncbi:hypothetical protein P7C70_g5671, partial [Phenoliferia sp. Uapishka_3]